MNPQIFRLLNFRFFLLTFHCIYEASTAKIYSELTKNYKNKQVEKIKSTPPYVTYNSIDQNLSFKFVAVASPKWVAYPKRAPTRKKYVTAQPNFFQMH